MHMHLSCTPTFLFAIVSKTNSPAPSASNTLDVEDIVFHLSTDRKERIKGEGHQICPNLI